MLENPCFNSITAYAETKNKKVKRNPADNGAWESEREAETKSLTEEFNSMGEGIYDAKTAIIEKEYDLKLAALPVQSEKWKLEKIAQVISEGVKLSISQAIANANKDAEDNIEQFEENMIKNNEKRINDNISKNVARIKEKDKQVRDQIKNTADDLQSRYNNVIKEDIMEAARAKGREWDAKIDTFASQKKEEYERVTNEAKLEAEAEGERLGEAKLEKINAIIREEAEDIIKLIRTTTAKVEIVKKTLMQKVKLQLCAKIGLS